MYIQLVLLAYSVIPLISVDRMSTRRNLKRQQDERLIGFTPNLSIIWKNSQTEVQDASIQSFYIWNG